MLAAGGLRARARRHRPSIANGDASRELKERIANRRAAIRSKKRFWRAAMRREAGRHENIFIAKSHDLESVRYGFGAFDESRRHRRGIDCTMQE
jgi:transposase